MQMSVLRPPNISLKNVSVSLMAKKYYLFFLANSVSSGLGLQVILRVPVWVKDDHSVSWGQINAQTTGTGGQEETEILEKRKRNH